MIEHIEYTSKVANDWKQAIADVSKDYSYLFKRVLDCSTSSQLQSKLWLVNELLNIYTVKDGLRTELQKHDISLKETLIGPLWPKNIALLGGWYANFSTELLITNIKAEFVHNCEFDEDAKIISYKFNKRYKDSGQYKCDIKDVMWQKFTEMVGERIVYDLIINTSCEHMFPMTRFYSLNKFENFPLYVLQSTNDREWDDHINCVSSPDELIEQAKITEVLYSGEQELDNGMKRFMVIGYPDKEGYRNDEITDSRLV